MFRPRIFNCFTFLPPCLMSRFGYTAVSNLSFLLGAGKNDWRASCRTRTGWGSTFTLNVCSEFFTPAGMKTEELHRHGLFAPSALARRRLEACEISEALGPPDYGRLPKFAGN